MGQTLTNGIYLPDEGERNCYNGLAANWSILDGAVGTVAEHTTALSGKAPLVHTHTKSDITDFPAYGTTAGTICEGNDSRLSDARTPVAHTHTKSDVTDLLNSNFIPSANNSYDLGSSSYQWNKVYSKEYYYNGTAWGLDQANIWSANNKFTGNVTIEKSTSSVTALSDASLALASTHNYIFFRTMGSSNYKSYNAFLWGGYLNGSAPYRYGRIKLYRSSAIYGETGAETPDTSFSFIDVALHYKWVSLTDNIRFINDGTANACEPLTTNATDLGTSTNKWKTLNGISPGALSFPNYSDTTYIDISGSIVPPSGETTINYSGDANQYTPPVDGWLSIRCDGATFLQIYRNSYNCPGTTASRQDASGKLVVTLPVLKKKTYTIKINTSGSTNIFQLYPCLGNV